MYDPEKKASLHNSDKKRKRRNLALVKEMKANKGKHERKMKFGSDLV